MSTIDYCHSLITLSHPHVTIVDGAMGCHFAPIHGPWECAFRRRYTFVVFQSQNQSVPSPSPLARNLPFGENVGWHANPAVVCPLKFFFRCCLNCALAAARREGRQRGRKEGRKEGRWWCEWLHRAATRRGWTERTEGADLVVERLADDVLSIGVHHHRGHRVHAGLGDVFDRDGNIKFPHEDLLVVARRHEATPLVKKRHGIDRREMVVILLRDAPGGGAAASRDVRRRLPNVVLQRGAVGVGE